VPISEAAGLASIATGARAMQPDDTTLLGSVTSVLNSLYAHYWLPEQV
jgi:hypothetical protein